MINRVIFEGKVYYKVADLAELFDVSVYKMKKAIKAQDIETRLKGFGRVLFVLEENVCKIELNNEIKILETDFTTNPVKETKIIEPAVKPAKAKKPVKKGVKQKKPQLTLVENKSLKQSDLEIEYEKVKKAGQELALMFINAQQSDIAQDISYEHLGKNNNFIDAPIEDLEKMKLVVNDLQALSEELI